MCRVGGVLVYECCVRAGGACVWYGGEGVSWMVAAGLLVCECGVGGVLCVSGIGGRVLVCVMWVGCLCVSVV